MERALYQQLVAALSLPVSAVPHFAMLARRFGVSPDTVYSIYHQEVTARILRTHHLLRGAGYEYAQRYLSGAELLALCYEVDLPPCTVLRVLLERLPLGIPPGRLTALLRQPALLPTLAQPAAWARHCAEAGGDPTALPAFLAQLQWEVELCIDCDGCASPAADLSRHNAGREYEALLYQSLTQAGVAYWTEDDLRDKGFHKTPDAKLQVPIAVQGRIVNWIDSKATFGDDKTHRDQALGQYQKYVNRFGPGLVIYWHGFIRDLSQLEGGEDVLLLDHFPQPHELLTLPRLPLELALSSVGLPQPASAAGTDEAATGVKGQAAAAGEVQEAALERDAQAGGQLQQVACGSKC